MASGRSRLLVGKPDLVLDPWLLELGMREELELPGACGSPATVFSMLRAAKVTVAFLQIHSGIVILCDLGS